MWWARSRWARDAEGPVRVSNDKVARVRRISQTVEGDKVHLDGEAMGAVLDAWNDGATAEGGRRWPTCSGARCSTSTGSRRVRSSPTCAPSILATSTSAIYIRGRCVYHS